MVKVTVDNIMRAEPCEEYTRERVEKLWAGREYLELEEILALGIPNEDIMWAMTKVVITDDRQRRLLSYNITKEIELPIWGARHPDDGQPRNASDAWDAASVAVRTAGSAAWDAAWAAGSGSVARDVAKDAARVAAWKKIFNIVRRYL